MANLSFIRAGEVSGRVLDEETREPAPGVRVTLFTKQWNYGKLTLVPIAQSPAITEADGRFRFPGLNPGEYLASARPRGASVERLENFSKDDLAKIDEAYPPIFWPGGDDAASAFGAVLTPVGYTNVGSMFVRKTRQYRVHTAMQGNCTEGDSVDLSVLRRDGGTASLLGTVPCSGELLIQGFDPGSYFLYASSEQRNGNLANTVSGAVSVEVVDKNLNISLPLQPNVVIEGQLTIANRANAPRLLPRITARPFDLIPRAQLASDTAILWAPDQRHFQLAVSPRTQTLVVSDPDGGYVREVFYNGTPLRGSTLPINPGASSHKLEIVVDDKYGSLAGSVTDGSRGVPAMMIILKDFTRVEDLYILGTFSRPTGPDEGMPAAQLAPGDYRVLAFTAAQQMRIHEAGVLERMLSTAQRVTVSPGSAQTVTIRLSDLR